MADKLSSLDPGYVSGDLSVYPEAIDDKESLFDVRNNAETVLSQTLPFSSKLICVKDASGFPPNGLLRIGPRKGAGNAELIHYGTRTDFVFSDLTRGYAGTVQTKWEIGAWVTNSVMADHHNAVKDAILNIENNLGIEKLPTADSLNGLLKQVEVKHIAPKPSFRAFPQQGVPPLNVRFQNFSNGDVIRYIWDFGDGTGSVEKNPNHIYQSEGVFTIKLNMITSTGSQAVMIKNNYVTVSNESNIPFFYIVQSDASAPAFSIVTATSTGGGAVPATFEFVDQTDGEIASRLWVFDDGTTDSISDPNIHSTTHVYSDPGEYNPFLLVQFTDQKLKRIFPQEPLLVL